MNDQLSVTDIIDMLIKRWWIWVIAAVSLSIVTFIYSEVFVDPLYRTDGNLYVNAQRTQTSDISQQNQLASQTLVTTYKEILGSRSFLSQVAEDVDNLYTIENLKKMISMSSVNGTEILQITVTGKIPEDVYKICHSVLIHAPDELIRVVNAGSVKILDDGQIPTAPVSPNVKRNVLIAFMAGMILGAFVILVLELFDTRIKSRDDIVNKYEEPLLGEIPAVYTIKAGDER